MNIILTALDSELAAAWQRHCGHFPFVRVHHGSIFDVEADALVSPANSFGFMDGGIDLEYIRRFGQQLEDRVRGCLRTELCVGQALLVSIVPDLRAGYHFKPISQRLIVAPTMRVPMRLPADTINPYLAAKAAISASCELHIDSIAFPGMGTGCGHVPPDRCAWQMRCAIEDTLIEPFRPTMIAEAEIRHHQIAGTEGTKS